MKDGRERGSLKMVVQDSHERQLNVKDSHGHEQLIVKVNHKRRLSKSVVKDGHERR